jgi:serine/threonine protein kinase
MAPERFLSKRIGVQSDIFSLGVMFARIALNRNITINDHNVALTNSDGFPLSSQEIIIEGKYFTLLREQERPSGYWPKRYHQIFVDLLKRMIAYDFDERLKTYEEIHDTLRSLCSYKRQVFITNKKSSLYEGAGGGLTPHPLENKKTNKKWFTRKDIVNYKSLLSLKDQARLTAEIKEKIYKKKGTSESLLNTNLTPSEKYLKYIIGLREYFNEIYFRYNFLKRTNNIDSAKKELFFHVDSILNVIRDEFPLRELEETQFLPHFFIEELLHLIQHGENKSIFDDEEEFRVCLNIVCSIHFLVSSVASWYFSAARRQKTSFSDKITILKKKTYNPLFFSEAEDIYIFVRSSDEDYLRYVCVLSTRPTDQKIFQSLFFESFWGRDVEEDKNVKKVRIYFQSFPQSTVRPHWVKQEGDLKSSVLLDEYFSTMNYKAGADSIVAIAKGILSEEGVDKWKQHLFRIGTDLSEDDENVFEYDDEDAGF